MFEPELYSQFLAASQKRSAMPDLSESSVPVMALAIVGVGFLVISAWGMVAWGAYRQLNGLSKLRSFAAMLIAGILSWPVLAIVLIVGSAVSP